MRDIKKVIPILAPVVAAGTVVWGAASSLGGYTTPVYGSDEFQVSADGTQGAEVFQEALHQKSSQDNPAALPKEDPEEDLEVNLGNEPDGDEATAPKGSFDLADGSYEGTGTGFSGPVKVSVKIQDRAIAAIDVVSHSDDEAFFDRAKNGVIQSILSAQSVEVDAVSGATYSSNGIINAVKNALAGQGGSTAADTPTPTPAPVSTPKPVKDPAAYKDGTYTGTGTGFAGELTVQVKISGGKIKKIKIVKTSDGPEYIERASALIQKIVQAQGTNVDVVSGATYSSTGIIGAVRDALGKAAVTDNKKPRPTTTPKKTPTPTAAQTKRPAASGKFPYPDGSYTGIGEGFGGDVAVTVVIKNKSIKEIQITSHEGEDDAFFDRAKTIADKIVQEQDIAVDAVSGATYSSNGILQGVKDAIEAAKKASVPATPTPAQTPTPTVTPTAAPTPTPEETPTVPATSTPSVYIDGSYKVTVPCVPDEYYDFDEYGLTLTLVMENDKIVDIRNITGDGGPDNNSYITRASKGSSVYPGVVSQILEKNSIEGVDTVTRATCSSWSIIEACRQALEAAKRR